MFTVLRYLRVHRQVLHRDISKGNVLYVLEETTPAEAGSDGVQIGSGETKEVPLLFIKYLLGERCVSHSRSGGNLRPILRSSIRRPFDLLWLKC